MQYLILAVLIYLVIYMLDFKGYRRDGKRWPKIIELEQYLRKHGLRRGASEYRKLRKDARKKANLARNLDAFEQSLWEIEDRNYSARRTQESLNELNKRLFDLQMRL